MRIETQHLQALIFGHLSFARLYWRVRIETPAHRNLTQRPRFARLYWRVRIETYCALAISQNIKRFARLYWRVRIETQRYPGVFRPPQVSPAFIGGCGLKLSWRYGCPYAYGVSPAFIGGCGLKLVRAG